MIDQNEVRNLLQYAYCLDLDDFCEIFDRGKDNRWCKEKFRIMQQNFTRFFCDLDGHRAQLFIDASVLGSG